MFTEKYKALINAIAENETPAECKELTEFVEKKIASMSAYIGKIVDYQIGNTAATTMLRAGKISVEDYQFRLKSLDELRRSSHDNMLAAMNQINRLADRYGVEHPFPDNQDRHMRAKFAAVAMMECFMVDHNHGEEDINKMYKLVYGNWTTEN